jgi:ribonuclease-3
MNADSAMTALQTRLGYTFRDAALLELALTHPSVVNESPAGRESNQRLEFLGDAVLQLLLAEELYARYPGEREGLLSKRRSLLVNQRFLTGLAREAGVDQCLRLGRSEHKTGGRSRPSVLSDAFEAVVGAIYLDSDLATARRVIIAVYGDLDRRLEGLLPADNPKGRLQELVQPTHGNSALCYEVIRTTGEDHLREYEVAVRLLDRVVGTDTGSSKQNAEEAAARAALATLRTTPLS